MKLKDFLKQFEDLNPEIEIFIDDSGGSHGDYNRLTSDIVIGTVFTSNAVTPKSYSLYKLGKNRKKAVIIRTKLMSEQLFKNNAKD